MVISVESSLVDSISSPQYGVQPLNSTQYANALANLNTSLLEQSSNVDFRGDCSGSINASEGRLVVCRTANTTDASSSSTGIIIGFVCGALVLAAIVWLFVRRRRANSAAKKQPQEEEKLTFVSGDSLLSPTTSATREARTTTLKAPDVVALRIPMDALTIGTEISQGAFGRVYRGSYQGERVAIKRLAPHRRKELKQFMLFVDEAKLMASMRHARVIRFVGIAWSSPLDLHVVTEYMDGGDLRVLLAQYQEQRRPTGFSRDKLKIALHVAEGLAYMHALRPKVLHRDLKSRNVLLTTSLDAKLIDFGVARERADHTMTTGVGTLRWMAPEVMAGGHYGESADVFSLGVILSELDTHELPYCGADGVPMRDEAIIARVSMGTLSVRFSAHADAAVVALARECMALTPSDRPLAARVADQLELLLRAVS
ncbi:hypothetical protein PINS_up014377 [Pythium insidiosum]|nr:hypothetical protein PINS_up014377 [Pythium insidiosum]